MRDLRYCLSVDKSMPMNWHQAIPILLYIFSLGALGYREDVYIYSNYLGMSLAVYYAFTWLAARRPGIPAFVPWWAGYIVWLLVSGLIVAVYRAGVTGAAKTMVQLLVLTVIITTYVTSLRRLKLILWAIVIMAFIPLSGWVFGISEARYAEGAPGRLVGGASQPNTFGAILVVGAACGAVLFSMSRLKGKLIVLGLCICLSAGVVATASRGALVMLVFFLLAMYWFHYGVHLRSRYVQVLVGGACLAITLLVGWLFIQDTLLGERILDAFRAFQPSRLRAGYLPDRVFLALQALKLFLKHPLTGIGINNFRFVSETGLYPHNNFLVILTGTGIVGAMLYFAPFVVYWRKLKRVGKATSSETVRTVTTHMRVLMVTLLAYGVFTDTWRQKFVACFIGLIFGSALALRNLAALHAQYEDQETAPEPESRAEAEAETIASVQ